MKTWFIVTILVFASFFLNNGDSLPSEIQKLRIISLAPATTEILFSLGLDDEIVGVTSFCDYPPEALHKEKVGTFSQPDIEKIISLKPDIIFATGLEQAFTVEKLKHLGLEVFVSDPSNMEELFTSIGQIAKFVYREKESTALISQMKSRMDIVKSKTEGTPQDKKPKVFIEIWHDPLMTAGKGSFVDELISVAGGLNIAYHTPRPFSYFSPEQVIKHNPDCIILGHKSNEDITNVVKKRLGWKEIKAVKNNCIYDDIDPNLFLRPGPRLIEGLEKIHQRLYPK